MKPKTAITLFVTMIVAFFAYMYAFYVYADDSYYFGRNLTVGSVGPDVADLQKALNSDPATSVASFGPGSPGSESEYFGARTRNAVIKFQRKHGILPSAGYVGSMTRAKLNSISVSQSGSSTSTPVATTDVVCNENLLKDGVSANKMITLEACKRLNELYKSGQAAGNVGDMYVNRDNAHVNFCVDWSPVPECPLKQRLFPQISWHSSAGGFVSTPFSGPTIGQASYSGSHEGDIKHSILFDKYKNQSSADTLYNLYTKNNLFIYPSLYEDSYLATIYDSDLLSNPTGINEKTDNVANTPYLIGSKQICDCGAGSLRIHDASGSDLPFVELSLAGLAAFRPEVKKALISGVTVDGKNVSLLIPTLQSMIRYAHRSVSTPGEYLEGDAHGSSYTAHVMSGGKVVLAYDSNKLVSAIHSLTLDSAPPLVRLNIVRETFLNAERTFATPGAISRTLSSDEPRSITVSAADSVDARGMKTDMEYRFVVLKGAGEAVITVSSDDPSRATIDFDPNSGRHRIDVGVFVKKKKGEYYSVPGIISLYIRS